MTARIIEFRVYSVASVWRPTFLVFHVKVVKRNPYALRRHCYGYGKLLMYPQVFQNNLIFLIRFL